ncbi:hypothetical protein GF362_00250 [Candidatus Dojkabacteria bacterium]|nr:hypothetical protein [Candidatus Dojkabacteria bacterium]
MQFVLQRLNYGQIQEGYQQMNGLMKKYTMLHGIIMVMVQMLQQPAMVKLMEIMIIVKELLIDIMKEYKLITKILIFILILMIGSSFIVGMFFVTGIWLPDDNSSYLDNNQIHITETPKPSITEIKLKYFENCTKESSDPFLYPITKDEGLDQDYVPKVIPTNLTGGKEVTESIIPYLKKLFQKAKSEGINLQIISGYRSYQTQENIFNSYVNSELNANPYLGYEDAVIKANIYSAKPGHSEHQLGTTVDIKCVDCTAFTFSEKNIEVYNFLEENANNFGFVISYPENTTEITGYKYEPWHIRYIGTELSLKYKKKNADKEIKQPLQKFLIDTCKTGNYG